jgi:hypothetical protein
MPSDSRPVDLLSDSKGLYGIGIVHDEVLSKQKTHKPLIFRPDVLRESADFPNEYREALLQTLCNRRFTNGFEWTLHHVMLNEALKRNPRYQKLENELTPRGGQPNFEKWSRFVKVLSDDEHRQAELLLQFAEGQQLKTGVRPQLEKELVEDEQPQIEVGDEGERGTLYRRIRWGQNKRQLINLNGMLKRLLAEAAEPNALNLARRFHPVVRENIYRGAAISERALRLIDVFPVLGIAVYCPPGGEGDCWWNKAPDAAKMVERGARMNRIASFMDVPMWARKLKPAVAHWFCYMPDDLRCYLPEKTWEQRLWLRAFKSRGIDDPDFAYWIARNVLKVGNRIRPVLDFLRDMDDRVKEAKREQPRCITRPFSPNMSLKTVRSENEIWHEAIAKCEVAKSNYKIPKPWYPAGQINGYQIVPLDSTEELWKEGRAMHHCAGSCDYRVAAGHCYIYSVRQGGNRVATVQLVKTEGKVKLGQIRAACNAEPPKEVKMAVKKWLSGLKAA